MHHPRLDSTQAEPVEHGKYVNSCIWEEGEVSDEVCDVATNTLGRTSQYEIR